MRRMLRRWKARLAGEGRLRIESDGTRGGTVVSFAGEKIRHVQEVAWHIDAKKGVADAVIVVKRVQLDVDEPADEAPVREN